MKKTTTTPPPTSTPRSKPKAPSPGSVSKAVCVGAASLTLACAGAPVSPPSGRPPPEPCPPGAIEAMASFRLSSRDIQGTGYFERGNFHLMTVTEGPSVVFSGAELKDFPQNSRLSGRLIFGDRVYGRFTRARSPDGKLDIPVCMELRDINGGLGIVYRGERGPTTAKVTSRFGLQPVEAFE